MSNAKRRRPASPRPQRPQRGPKVPQRTGPSSSTLVFAGVLVVVVLAGIIAIVVARGSGSEDSTAVPRAAVPEECGDSGPAPDDEVTPYRPVEITGAPLVEFPGNGESDPAVGEPAPVVSGLTFDGEPITLPCSGQPTLAIFLAHWCPHCQREVPALTEYWAEHGMPEGAEVVSVATGTSDDRPNFPPQAWLVEEDWPAPVLVDDEEYSAAQAYGLSSYPYFVLVGADGRVLLRASGEIDPAELDATVERLVQGAAPPAEGAGP